MNKEVKKILEEKFDYDFKSEFYTDEILLMIEEVIQATTLQLLQTDVSKCVYCDNKPYKKGAAYCEKHMASDDYS